MSSGSALRALAAVLLWGASFVATKIALGEVSPLTVIVLRFGIGVAVIALTLAWRRQLSLPRRSEIGWLTLLALNGITVHQILQAEGLVTTTATNSAWIVALIPAFTAIVARVVVRERFGARTIIGLAVAAGGALVVIGRGDLSLGLFGRARPGDWLMLASAFNWAVFTAASKRMIGRYPPAMLIGYTMAIGWLMMLPLGAFEGGWRSIPHLSRPGWASILFLGVGCSGFAYVFWYDALGDTEATVLSSFIYLEPAVTVVVAAILLGERVSWPVVLGGGLIVAGVRLVSQPRGRSARTWLTARSAPW
jgi:drug/metabolite transporter (DMT)-like permease